MSERAVVFLLVPRDLSIPAVLVVAVFAVVFAVVAVVHVYDEVDALGVGEIAPP